MERKINREETGNIE